MRDGAAAYGCQVFWSRHARGPPTSEVVCDDPHLGWLSRAIILKRERIVICGIEKNAITVLNSVAAKVSGRPFAWFAYSPYKQAEPLDDASIFRWRDAQWRRAVVLREPIERFCSAWASKCGPTRDHDGHDNCEACLGFAHRDNATILAVIERLHSQGCARRNAHWAPQASFCNGTLETHWHNYTHRIDFRTLTASIPSLLRGRVPDSVVRAVRHDLSERNSSSLLKGTRFSDTHHAHAGRLCEAQLRRGDDFAAARRQLERYYAADARLYARVREGDRR